MAQFPLSPKAALRDICVSENKGRPVAGVKKKRKILLEFSQNRPKIGLSW
jgi:hypothetical protein